MLTKSTNGILNEVRFTRVISMQIRALKALILVGGLGTRLRSIVSEVPKPMAKFAGKPFLEYKLLHLQREGVRKVVFCSGYKSEIIQDYFGDGSAWDMQVEYSIEKERLGTGGAIKLAEDLVEEPFLAMNGDCYLENDIGDMLGQFESRNAEGVILLAPPRNPKEEGHVEYDTENCITGFKEKPDREFAESEIEALRINAGMYLFDPVVFDLIPAGKKVSLEREIFPQLVARDNLYCAFYDGYFIDIGTPKFYEIFQADLDAGKIKHTAKSGARS